MGGPNSRQLIKIQIFIKRKPGMTPQEFHEHWGGPHAKFAMNIPGFKDVVKKYAQYQLFPECQEKAGVIGLPALDFDGVAEMWVESVEDYVKHMKQDHLVEMFREEAKNYLGPGSQILIGYETVLHEDSIPGSE